MTVVIFYVTISSLSRILPRIIYFHVKCFLNSFQHFDLSAIFSSYFMSVIIKFFLILVVSYMFPTYKISIHFSFIFSCLLLLHLVYFISVFNSFSVDISCHFFSIGALSALFVYLFFILSLFIHFSYFFYLIFNHTLSYFRTAVDVSPLY